MWKAIMLLVLVVLAMGIAGEMELQDKIRPLEKAFVVVTDKDGEPQLVQR